ncbi:MAG: 50S ribosomal protein L23 [Phycisphaerales bacterium]|jgi:large subunit ribosomal protein L23|nr:MAG: 50S ribosomal protein L23 [Planctomycetota bacterium]
MESTVVIRRPIVTEKASFATSKSNQYTFEVDGKATKEDIKKAVKKLYNVRVLSVNTSIRKARDRAMKFGLVTGKLTKRAMVKIHAEDKIELF